MDQIKFSLKDISKYLLKWMVVALVLMLVAANGSRAAAEILNEPPPTVSVSKKNGPKINQHILIVVGCVLIPLLLICFSLFFIRSCAEKQLALAANTGYHSQRSSMKIAIARGLDPAIIATFKSFMFSAVKEIKLGQHVLECAVCLNEFRDHEALRLLPECSHVFHRECIDEWLGLHVTCPVCRASLVPKPNNEPESYCGPNVPQINHVSIQVTDLKHDILPSRKISGSYSMGHLVVKQPAQHSEKHTLRLPEEISYSLKNSVNDSSTSHDVLFPMEDILKNSYLKSASANFVRGSD